MIRKFPSVLLQKALLRVPTRSKTRHGNSIQQLTVYGRTADNTFKTDDEFKKSKKQKLNGSGNRRLKVWRRHFQSNSNTSDSWFSADEILKWCTGVLSLSSVIVGHKWVYGKDKEKLNCPLHHFTKDTVRNILLNTTPRKSLVFAVNSDEKSSDNDIYSELETESHLLVETSELSSNFDDVAQEFQHVAKECNGSLLNGLAVKLAEGNQHGKAFKMFKEASKLGNTTASYNTAVSYENGIGTKKSITKAAKYYAKAGNKNHAASLYRLASLYYTGFLGESNNNDGLGYAKKSADLGHCQAQLFVGLRSTEEKNWNTAFKYFQMAALQNDSSSTFNLAICYEKGYGTKLNLDKAMELYRKGAERGHVMSQFYLADSYQYGSRGVDKDLKEALKWFGLARENGHPEAIARIEHIQYELDVKSENDLLTLLESNTLAHIIEPAQQILKDNPFTMFHKCFSMPSLHKVPMNNDGSLCTKAHHRSALVLEDRSLSSFISTHPIFYNDLSCSRESNPLQ